MANIIKRVWNQNRMVQIEDLKGMTFQAEQAGHTFQISGIDDEGNTVALTGTPSGVLLRPDNTDVALTCSVSGGVVSATLPANCYDVPGRFGLTIFITSGSSKTAIYAAVGTVTRTSSGTAAPGTTKSVVDLINAINAAVNSIPASYSALLADIAPTYSNSALYSVGQYAWYDGDLKRCIVPITTAESYTAAHWTSAVLCQDVSDLKSAFDGNAFCSNLMGMTLDMYPVFIPAGAYITVSTSDGSIAPSGHGTNLRIYDANKTRIDYYTTPSNNSNKRTIQIPQDVYYMDWNKIYSVPLMVNMGEDVLPYVPYFPGVKKLKIDTDAKFASLDEDIEAVNEDIATINEDVAAVNEDIRKNYHGDGYGIFSKTGSVSKGITVTDKGSLEFAIYIPITQTNKALFDMVSTVSGSKFYMELGTLYGNNTITIKIGSNSERKMISLANKSVHIVRVDWDGTTDSSNKVYTVYINGEQIYSGAYTGTVGGTVKIKAEGSWSVAEVQWLYFVVNGVPDVFETNFDYGKSYLPEFYMSGSGGENDILQNYPPKEMESALVNATRAFRDDQTTPTATAPLTLMWCSDIHTNSANTDRMSEFHDKYKDYFDDAIHTGDLTTAYAESTTFWEPCKKFLNVIGNHEYWGDVVGGVRQMKTPLEVYQKFIAPYISSWTGVVFPSDASTAGKSYYYKDYSSKKIRLVVMDYKEIEYNSSSVQLTWLASVLNDTLDSSKTCYGYSVVIAVHAPAFLAEQDAENPFDSLDIKSNKDGVINSAIPNAVSTFISNGGSFVCYLTGHNHTDHFGVGVNYQNQLNITVGTASSSNNSNTFDIGRKVGTKSQDLFNIISIDTYSKFVKLIRIGAEYDRQLRKRTYLCYYYGNDVFDASKTYSMGQTVIQNEKLYQFTENHSGAWTGNDVNELPRLVFH